VLIVETGKISKKSLFGIIFVEIGLGSLLLFILIASLSFLDLGSLTINADLELGPIDFVFVLLIWPIFAMLWIILTWAILVPGLWVFGRTRVIRIRFQDSEVPSRDHGAEGT
jgi:hypothetical protein